MLNFMPNSQKTAQVTVTVNPPGLASEIELFLGPNEQTKVATSGRRAFVSAGVGQQISLLVSMPAATGDYNVYLDVWTQGLLIASFIGKEKVQIGAQGVTIDSFSIRVTDWGSGSGRSEHSSVETAIELNNNTGATLAASYWMRNRLHDDTYLAPGTSYSKHHVSNFFRIGAFSLPPGKSAWGGLWELRNATFLRNKGIVEGTRGVTEVTFEYANYAPTPIQTIYHAVASFAGIFSSDWQTWQPVTFTPPEYEENGE